MAAAGSARDVDYAEAGRELLARVNLPADGSGVPRVERYSNYNALWRHPSSGGTLYVGNASTAASRQMLDEIKCRAIVFCQESDGKMHFKDDPAFTYLQFPIGAWRRTLAAAPDPDATMAYFKVRLRRPLSNPALDDALTRSLTHALTNPLTHSAWAPSPLPSPLSPSLLLPRPPFSLL